MSPSTAHERKCKVKYILRDEQGLPGMLGVRRKKRFETVDFDGKFPLP